MGHNPRHHSTPMPSRLGRLGIPLTVHTRHSWSSARSPGASPAREPPAGAATTATAGWAPAAVAPRAEAAGGAAALAAAGAAGCAAAMWCCWPGARSRSATRAAGWAGRACRLERRCGGRCSADWWAGMPSGRAAVPPGCHGSCAGALPAAAACAAASGRATGSAAWWGGGMPGCCCCCCSGTGCL